jgi:chromosome segregation ATPase
MGVEMTDKLMTTAEWAALSAESRAAINNYDAEYEAMQKRIAELRETVSSRNYQAWALADELRSQLSDAYKRIVELEAKIAEFKNTWKSMTDDELTNNERCEHCGLPLLMTEPDPETGIGEQMCVYCTWERDQETVFGQKYSELQKRIDDLETRLSVACHIEADDKAGFDWAVLDRIHELEATVNRLRNCHNCANNPGDTPCEYVYNCNDSSHWRPLPQPPEVSE